MNELEVFILIIASRSVEGARHCQELRRSVVVRDGGAGAHWRERGNEVYFGIGAFRPIFAGIAKDPPQPVSLFMPTSVGIYG